MSNSIIERVARAICWKNGMNPDLTLGGDGQNFLWHEYEDQARAAIAEMREPTQGMMMAFSNAIMLWQDEKGDDEDVFRAMIDAALKEPGNG